MESRARRAFSGSEVIESARKRPADLLLAGAIALAAGCQDVAVTAVPVLDVAVQPETASIVIGETQELSAILTDGEGNELMDRAVVWSSDDAAVAEVDGDGLVTAMGIGTTRIRATAEGRTGEGTITVIAEPVGRVLIEPIELTLPQGGEDTIHAVVRADDGAPLDDRDVSWSSSAEEIAEVTGHGPHTRAASVRAHGCPRGEASCAATIAAMVDDADAASDEIDVTVFKIATAVSISPSVVTDTLDPSQTVELTAMPTADDGSTDLSETRTVTWMSSASSTAELSPTEGVTTVVTANDPACPDQPVCIAGITAKVDGVVDRVDVHVRKAIATLSVVPASVTVPRFFRHEQTFTATPLAEDGTPLPDRSITWASTGRGNYDSPCGLGNGLARVTLSPTTGPSTTVTVRAQLVRSLVWIWAETEGVVGCASLQIGS